MDDPSRVKNRVSLRDLQFEKNDKATQLFSIPYKHGLSFFLIFLLFQQCLHKTRPEILNNLKKQDFACKCKHVKVTFEKCNLALLFYKASR